MATIDPYKRAAAEYRAKVVEALVKQGIGRADAKRAVSYYKEACQVGQGHSWAPARTAGLFISQRLISGFGGPPPRRAPAPKRKAPARRR